jgi:rhodanese-related sulfurtransferase
MKKISTFVLIPASLFLFSCGNLKKPVSATDGKTIVVDVRTPEEWNNDGHAPCTVNYPLDKLSDHIDSLRKYDHVILVCRSGKRAGQAKDMLEQAGIKGTENLGSWTSVKCP